MERRNMVIVIDAGHGGSSPAGKSTAYGSRGPSGTFEKDVTLAVANGVAQQLGPAVVLTRSDDRNISLAERCERARLEQAAVFVSLHAGAGAPGERGARAFVHPRGSNASRGLAHGIAHALGGRGVELGELAVLAPERHAPHTASCLVEMDNLSDRSAEARLRDPAEVMALARAISHGIVGSAQDFSGRPVYGHPDPVCGSAGSPPFSESWGPFVHTCYSSAFTRAAGATVNFAVTVSYADNSCSHPEGREDFRVEVYQCGWYNSKIRDCGTVSIGGTLRDGVVLPGPGTIVGNDNYYLKIYTRSHCSVNATIAFS